MGKSDAQQLFENTKGIRRFGMSLFDMTSEKFMASEEFNVFTFGRPPVCIEILTAVKGLNFKEAFINSTLQNFDHVMVRMIDIRDLVTAKKQQIATRTKTIWHI